VNKVLLAGGNTYFNSSSETTIRRLESGEIQKQVMAAYNIESSNIYDIKKQKGQLQSFMALSESVRASSSDRS
jgi:hypothetical protein